MYLHVWWLYMRILRVFMLIILLCYINMNVITQGLILELGYITMDVIVYVPNLEYNKHESACVWADYRV